MYFIVSFLQHCTAQSSTQANYERTDIYNECVQKSIFDDGLESNSQIGIWMECSAMRDIAIFWFGSTRRSGGIDVYQPHTLEHTHTLERSCECMRLCFCKYMWELGAFRPQPNPFDKPKCNKNHTDATATGLPTTGTLHDDDDDDDDENSDNEVQIIEKSIKSECLLVDMLHQCVWWTFGTVITSICLYSNNNGVNLLLQFGVYCDSYLIRSNHEFKGNITNQHLKLHYINSSWKCKIYNNLQ